MQTKIGKFITVDETSTITMFSISVTCTYETESMRVLLKYF